MASKDQFGLKVKLPNGNVATRVLPIKIHELGQKDIKECEEVIGSVLRGIEFIYSEPGVNKPLTQSLNSNKYSIQINKVANAIEEIISAVANKYLDQDNQKNRDVNSGISAAKDKAETYPKRKRQLNYKLFGIFILIITLSVVGILILPKFSGRNDSTTSIAILPFKNMSDDENLTRWQKGIQDELINRISGSTDDFKVIPADVVNSIVQQNGNDGNLLTDKIRKKLKTDLSITGTIVKSGSILRINAQIIDNKSGKVLQPYYQEGSPDAFFELIDPLAQSLKGYLAIRSMKDEVYIDPERMGYSNDAEAYRYFTYGQKAFGNTNMPVAIKLLKEAEKRDSGLTYATLHIALAYNMLQKYDSARIWCNKVWKRKNTLPYNQQVYLEVWHNFLFGGLPEERLDNQKHLLEIDNQWAHAHYDIGLTYSALRRYSEAIEEFEKALELYREQGIKPWWFNNYTELAKCYKNMGQYRKAIRILRKAQKEFPDAYVKVLMAEVLFSRGKIKKGEKYLQEWKSFSESNREYIPGLIERFSIDYQTAQIYSGGGMYDKAENILRQWMNQNPQDTTIFVACISMLLTETDKIVSASELNTFNKIFENLPEHFYPLYVKGYGLFKLKRYQEAYDSLQRSWKLRLENAIYDTDAFYRLKQAKDSLDKSLSLKN
jgi:tetratricopeptide (TPR) repeat protein